MPYRLSHGNNIDLLKAGGENKIHALVCDPPYGLSAKEPDVAEVLQHWLAGDDYIPAGTGFGGKRWDSIVPGPNTWRECLRVMRPGAHGAIFSSPRTVDLLTIALRLAGFEIRGTVQWLTGQGMVKGRSAANEIDKHLGVEREQVGERSGDLASGSHNLMSGAERVSRPVYAATSPEARQWEGWHSQLKPCHEPIILVRKPFGRIETTTPSGNKGSKRMNLSENLLHWGVGALNLEGCMPPEDAPPADEAAPAASVLADRLTKGRMPGDIILSVDAAAELDGRPRARGRKAPSSFFYVAKAGRKERDAGLEEFEARFAPTMNYGIGAAEQKEGEATGGYKKNTGLCVKPLELMEVLVRLLTPPGGIVLDPFMGTGSTGIAATTQGFVFVGMEIDADDFNIAQCRIAHWNGEPIPAPLPAAYIQAAPEPEPPIGQIGPCAGGCGAVLEMPTDTALQPICAACHARAASMNVGQATSVDPETGEVPKSAATDPVCPAHGVYSWQPPDGECPGCAAVRAQAPAPPDGYCGDCGSTYYLAEGHGNDACLRVQRELNMPVVS